MKLNHTLTIALLLSTSVASLSAENATKAPSAMIDFATLINEMCAIIPENASRKGSGTQEDVANILNGALVEETYAFLNAAYQADALRPLIEHTHDYIQKKVELTAETLTKDWTQYLFEGLITQTVGYLALQREFTQHENVILRFTAPWCPPCQFFAPVLERCAKVYASNVRIINIDITQHKILGIVTDSIPLLVFFKNGQEVFRQTGLNLEPVTKKYIDPNSAECKKEALDFLEDDLNKAVQKYLLS